MSQRLPGVHANAGRNSTRDEISELRVGGEMEQRTRSLNLMDTPWIGYQQAIEQVTGPHTPKSASSVYPVCF